MLWWHSSDGTATLIVRAGETNWIKLLKNLNCIPGKLGFLYPKSLYIIKSMKSTSVSQQFLYTTFESHCLTLSHKRHIALGGSWWLKLRLGDSSTDFISNSKLSVKALKLGYNIHVADVLHSQRSLSKNGIWHKNLLDVIYIADNTFSL